MAHSHDHHHHGGNILVKFGQALHLPGFTHEHSHSALAGDSAFLDNQLAIRTVWIALLALGHTTALQVVIYVASGSVALLADTVGEKIIVQSRDYQTVIRQAQARTFFLLQTIEEATEETSSEQQLSC